MSRQYGTTQHGLGIGEEVCWGKRDWILVFGLWWLHACPEEERDRYSEIEARQRHRIYRICPPVCIEPVNLSVLSLPVCLHRTCLPASEPVSICPVYIDLSASSPPICPSVRPSVRPSVNPSVCQSVRLPVRLPAPNLSSCQPASQPISRIPSNLRHTCHPARVESVTQRVIGVRV